MFCKPSSSQVSFVSGTNATPYSVTPLNNAVPGSTVNNTENNSITNRNNSISNNTNINYGQLMDNSLVSGNVQVSNFIPNSSSSLDATYAPFQKCLDQRQLNAQASGILPPGVTCGGSQSISYPGTVEQFAIICDQFISDCNSLRPQIDQVNSQKIDCFTLDGDMCTQLQVCLSQGQGPPNFDPRPKCTTNPRGLFSSDCSNVTVIQNGVCNTYPINSFQRCMYRGEKYMQKVSKKLPSNVDCGSMDNTQENKTLAATVCDEIINTCQKDENKYMESLTVN